MEFSKGNAPRVKYTIGFRVQTEDIKVGRDEPACSEEYGMIETLMP
jgi:hypothetical protein